MIRAHSAAERYHVFFVSAVLGAHFNRDRTGFRQRDVRFLVELFSNWMESTLGQSSLSIHNNQIARLLSDMHDRTWIRRVGRSRPPSYALTPVGLVKLVGRLAGREHFVPFEDALFAFYFLKTYGRLFDQYLKDQSEPLSKSIHADLAALREPEVLLLNQARYLKKEIEKLDFRIGMGHDAADLGDDTVQAGQGVEQVVAAIQARFPYELNSRKPLRDLIEEIPESRRLWELTQGLRNRSDVLWSPLRSLLSHQLEIIEGLLEEAK